MAKAKSESEKWFDAVKGTAANMPELIPEVGVRIECRLVVRSVEDWEYVQETLDRCREYGAAEVMEYKAFSGSRR